MRTARLTPSALSQLAPADLVGAVLLAPLVLEGEALAKGTRLGREQAARVLDAAAAGRVDRPLPLAWPGPDDVHEDDAASRLALAVSGAGVELRPLRQSRVDLAAAWDGVLHVRGEALRRLAAIEPLEVFTLFHGQAVARGQPVGAVKVAPHVLPAATLSEGLRIARSEGPVVEVRPYRTAEVGAIAFESMTAKALARFEAGARRKVEALGGTFQSTIVIGDQDPGQAEARARAALVSLAVEAALPVLLVGGVSAGDPVSPFFAALAGLGGTVLRRGVPAHPGSMIWLARLERSQLLGLPQCGMFSLATAADLVLPRLMTGEALTAESLADLAHGGLLGREMRFRMPEYARDLPEPRER